jgi:hypothetical protein
MIETDGLHYDELRTAIAQTADVPGATLEIGCRRGGGSVMIMEGNLGKNKTHIAVDPYGNIDYHDRVGVHKSDYTNHMKTQTMSSLYNWAYEHNYNFLFFNLEDTEFFKRFADGVPVYTDYKTIENKFSLVFVDGPHHTQAVLDAFEYLKDKMSTGGQIVFDNYDHYPHDLEVEPTILKYPYELVATGADKKVYKKL